MTNLTKLQVAALLGLFDEAAKALEKRGFDSGGAPIARHCSDCGAFEASGKGRHRDDCKLAYLIHRLNAYAETMREIAASS